LQFGSSYHSCVRGDAGDQWRAEDPELPLPKPEVEEVVLLDWLLLLPVVRALRAVVVCEEEAVP
jgi:hypothetical protein